MINDVGPDAFDYGLLIGHEDFRLTRDETADIFVTFPPRSIQEFLGAFYFIMMLNTGESIESFLGSDCKEPILVMNPLFLHFCLWFLYSDQEYFTINNSEKVCESLAQYCRERCGLLDRPRRHCFIYNIVKSYQATDIEGAVRKNDTLYLKFFKDVLQTVKVLIVKLPEQLKWILPTLNLTNLSFGKQTINQSVLTLLSTAVSKCLTHLSFIDCEDFNGGLLSLFKSKWPKLSCLDTLGTELGVIDVQTLFTGLLPDLQSLKLSDFPSRKSILFKEPCLNLTSLYLDMSWVEDSSCIVDAINKGLMPYLNSLAISRRSPYLTLQETKLNLEWFHLKQLHSLSLHCFINKSTFLKM